MNNISIVVNKREPLCVGDICLLYKQQMNKYRVRTQKEKHFVANIADQVSRAIANLKSIYFDMISGVRDYI